MLIKGQAHLVSVYLARVAFLAALMIGPSGIAFADPLGLRGASDDEWRFTVSSYLFLQGASPISKHSAVNHPT